MRTALPVARCHQPALQVNVLSPLCCSLSLSLSLSSSSSSTVYMYLSVFFSIKGIFCYKPNDGNRSVDRNLAYEVEMLVIIA